MHYNRVNAGFVERPEYWRYSSVEAYLGKEANEIVTVCGSVGDLQLASEWELSSRKSPAAELRNQGIHYNPVNAGFVERPEYWRYSSVEAYLGKEANEIITVYGSVGDLQPAPEWELSSRKSPAAELNAILFRIYSL